MSRSVTTCLCDDEWIDCPRHVPCDHDCKALQDPQTLNEWRAACTHWHRHEYTGGCSHGR